MATEQSCPRKGDYLIFDFSSSDTEGFGAYSVMQLSGETLMMVFDPCKNADPRDIGIKQNFDAVAFIREHLAGKGTSRRVYTPAALMDQLYGKQLRWHSTEDNDTWFVYHPLGAHHADFFRAQGLELVIFDAENYK